MVPFSIKQSPGASRARTPEPEPPVAGNTPLTGRNLQQDPAYGGEPQTGWVEEEEERGREGRRGEERGGERSQT